jgi:hypothetical protein
MFRSLAYDTSLFVEAPAPGAPRDLLELAHGEDPHLLAVELREAGEDHRADRDVDADAQGVGAEDHLEVALLGELLHEQAVLGKQPGVVDPDAVAQEAFDVLPVGGVEAGVREHPSDCLAFGPAAEARAGAPLGEVPALALGEVDHVDGRAPSLVELLEGLVQRRLTVLEVEGHRPNVRVHVGDRASAVVAQALLDARGIAHRRRHHQEEGVLQGDERDLPGDTAVAIGVVVELVEDHVGGVDLIAAAQRHVGEHLGGAADHRGIVVHAGVAGEHAHPLRPELLAEVEELFAHQGLHGCGVEGAPTLAERLPVERQGDHGLAGARGCGEHDVAIGEHFEDGLLLLGVEVEVLARHPVEEVVEDRVRVRGGAGSALGQVVVEPDRLAHRDPEVQRIVTSRTPQLRAPWTSSPMKMSIFRRQRFAILSMTRYSPGRPSMRTRVPRLMPSSRRSRDTAMARTPGFRRSPQAPMSGSPSVCSGVAL